MSRASNLTLFEDRLMQDAANGMTMRQLGEKYDITPEQAYVLIKQLLDDHDPWTEVESRKLLVHSLRRVKAEIERHSPDWSKASNVGAYTALIKTIDEITQKQTAFNDELVDRISAVQAKALVEMVEIAQDRAKKTLAELYPEADPMVIEQSFNEGLRLAAKVVDV